jgi:GSH-dependent disulfide-bond oxidoreductase
VVMKFHYNLSPGPLKVALLLAELSLPYEAIPVDQRKNPEAQVPLLEDGSAAVFDGNAILLYLADREHKFVPNKEQHTLRAQTLSWLSSMASELEPACAQARHFRYVAPKTIAPKTNHYELRLFDAEAHRLLTAIEQHLAHQAYFLGNDYSIVDMAFWSLSRHLPNILGCGEAIWLRYPNIKRLTDLISSRPAALSIEDLKSKHNFKVARRYRPSVNFVIDFPEQLV